jgi:uncharacterized circularly permuted ATP-grasp superfamily protein
MISPCAISAAWLRRSEGLRPVDVMIRRVDDAYCDLARAALRGDSLLGVPGGLLQAARQGHVALVNPLGSGVVEEPGAVRAPAAPARELLAKSWPCPRSPPGCGHSCRSR